MLAALLDIVSAITSTTHNSQPIHADTSADKHCICVDHEPDDHGVQGLHHGGCDGDGVVSADRPGHQEAPGLYPPEQGVPAVLQEDQGDGWRRCHMNASLSSLRCTSSASLTRSQGG